jgi:ATP-binding cassette, subfamily B, bacterial
MRRPVRNKTKSSRSIRTLVAPLVQAQRGRIARMSIAAILAGFAEAATLVLIARIAFALAGSGSKVSVNLGPLGTVEVPISALIVTAAVLVLVRMALQAISTVLASRASTTAIQQTRTSLIRSYLAAGWPLQSSQREGRLQELLTTYTDAGAGAVNALSQCVIGFFNLAALLITALWVNAIASVAAGLAALALGLILRPLRAAVRRRTGRAAAANLAFATGLTELSSTLQEVRVFGVETPVGDRLDELNRRNVQLTLRASYVGGSINVLYQGLALLLMVGALGLAYASGFSRLASLGAIVLIMLRSLSYAQTIQGTIQGLYNSAPYLETLDEERNQYRSSAMQHGGEPLQSIGSIRFEGVSFAYEPGLPVLKQISFEVPRGEIVGIIGPSGSGKSTLVQLLLRLREPTDGIIYVDGRDARRISLDEWYQDIAFVPQEAHLFAGSVADNIRFFRPDVDEAKIERAAKLAHIHEEIMDMPLGYDTPVGERGSQISGGQRQRLCIARALLEQPSAMVLDEPTSSLDVRSEALIRETIGELAPETTVFVIAHRLSTLAICDRLMVVLGGALEGFDRPAQLEASNPFYREALRLSGLR